MDDQAQNRNVSQLQNIGFMTDNIIQMRLNTHEILQKIQENLEGSVTIFKRSDQGELVADQYKTGIAKANKKGIQGILSFVTSVINSQTVQGNTDREEYEDRIQEINEGLISMILINAPEWGILDEDVEGITDFIMNLIMFFLSRTIDNKERESYAATLKHFEIGGEAKGASQKWNIFKRSSQ